jgi:CspA family cold shock protein
MLAEMLTPLPGPGAKRRADGIARQRREACVSRVLGAVCARDLRFGLPFSYPSGHGRAIQVTTTSRLFVTAPDLRAEIRYGGQKMAIGTVKFFNSAKGFGFIAPENGEKDVFVHVSAVERAGMDTLKEGQRVSFDVITERGKSAAGNLKAE